MTVHLFRKRSVSGSRFEGIGKFDDADKNSRLDLSPVQQAPVTKLYFLPLLNLTYLEILNNRFQLKILLILIFDVSIGGQLIFKPQ